MVIEIIPDTDIGGFTARVPDIPAYGEGETEDEAIADLKEALKGDDAAIIQAKTNALATASMKLGEAMYKQAEGAQPADTSESATGADGKKEDVVDAEFTEVDDDKNNKKSA